MATNSARGNPIGASEGLAENTSKPSLPADTIPTETKRDVVNAPRSSTSATHVPGPDGDVPTEDLPPKRSVRMEQQLGTDRDQIQKAAELGSK
ncbi:Valine--tRNA ligase [Purpureocillium takamizusanense]|uniref:Valine--tRNA ligase n=1 Tax=Purpureocillium takamizusanense TaxID=2060973 RepID=A0A9Q8QEY7_9HYPO|nr:Valine--tRNA ligase [Purpureocillium takamizusanense]UNI17686.1 Valine--tRNA ligase [Purpureocillium takamizusanense]